MGTLSETHGRVETIGEQRARLWHLDLRLWCWRWHGSWEHRAMFYGTFPVYRKLWHSKYLNPSWEHFQATTLPPT